MTLKYQPKPIKQWQYSDDLPAKDKRHMKVESSSPEGKRKTKILIPYTEHAPDESEGMQVPNNTPISSPRNGK